jgi:LacI family transcriptional regulator
MIEKITIYDIAKKLNITAATVSRALNNNPKISPKTKLLVVETAAKMNYKQNKLAKALQSGKSNNVGVIVPRIDSNFFASIIRGIEEELYIEGYHVIICQTNENGRREIENINTLLNAQVDGIFMSISNVNQENKSVFQQIIKEKVPLVFFDRKINMEGVSSVTIDDFKGGYLATQHLIDEGCERIAHFTGDQSLEIFKNRSEGYKKALSDNKIEYNTDYVIQTKSSVEEGKLAAHKLLNLKNPPDAIFSSSDFAALGAIQELKKNNVRIPEDFCVVGFGNEPFTKFMELAITSIDQSPMEMGKIAAKVFLEQINNPDNLAIEKKVVLIPELITRKSSNK